MSEERRAFWREQCQQVKNLSTLESALGTVIELLEHSQLYLEDGDYGDADVEKRTQYQNKREIESEIQQLCLPFLRIAALLRHHLYKEELPEIRTEQSEFVRLVYYLELVTEGMDWQKFNAAVALNWVEQPEVIVKNWCEEFVVFVNRSQVAARNLIDHHVRWQQPRLLRLPDLYDKIFQVMQSLWNMFYHGVFSSSFCTTTKF